MTDQCVCNNEPFEAGKRAYTTGQLLSKNPYAEWSQDFLDWDKGWLAMCREEYGWG